MVSYLHGSALENALLWPTTPAHFREREIMTFSGFIQGLAAAAAWTLSSGAWASVATQITVADLRIELGALAPGVTPAAIRVRLQLEHRARELALFDLGIDSKLRGCDLVKLKVLDVCHGERVATRAVVMQQKTQRPVQFELTPATRAAVEDWIRSAGLAQDDYLFPSRIHRSAHLGTRQYARILEGWLEEIGLDPTAYGTHTMRRTKATLIYRKTKNLRAVQLLLGHTKLESTVRYLGIEVDDALEISEQTDV